MSGKIACIAGARPNFMKMAALLHEMRGRPRLQVRFIHTGQHFSPEMSQVFFHDLGLPQPDCHLGVATGTQTGQTASIMCGLESAFQERPDLVVVVGDVNSTLAAALVASKMNIPVAHVEAGLRSFDRTMPEEINRIVTDVLSSYLFASEPSGVRNLIAEGIPERKIFLVGNVMIDTLLRFRRMAEDSRVLAALDLENRQYAVATLHRPSNVDSPERLHSLMRMLVRLGREIPVVFPVHPRTRLRLEEFHVPRSGVVLTPPFSYLDFLKLLAHSRLVLTDSGGIQEETTILGIPCLTIRENTERPITVEKGTNCLAGVDPDRILACAIERLSSPMPSLAAPDLWDGRAARRIVDVLDREIGREP